MHAAVFIGMGHEAAVDYKKRDQHFAPTQRPDGETHNPSDETRAQREGLEGSPESKGLAKEQCLGQAMDQPLRSVSLSQHYCSYFRPGRVIAMSTFVDSDVPKTDSHGQNVQNVTQGGHAGQRVPRTPHGHSQFPAFDEPFAFRIKHVEVIPDQNSTGLAFPNSRWKPPTRSGGDRTVQGLQYDGAPQSTGFLWRPSQNSAVIRMPRGDEAFFRPHKASTLFWATDSHTLMHVPFDCTQQDVDDPMQDDSGFGEEHVEKSTKSCFAISMCDKNGQAPAKRGFGGADNSSRRAKISILDAASDASHRENVHGGRLSAVGQGSHKARDPQMCYPGLRKVNLSASRGFGEYQGKAERTQVLSGMGHGYLSEEELSVEDTTSICQQIRRVLCERVPPCRAWVNGSEAQKSFSLAGPECQTGGTGMLRFAEAAELARRPQYPNAVDALDGLPTGSAAECWRILQELFCGRNEVEKHLLLRSLSLVAATSQLLTPLELYAAATTCLDESHGPFQGSDSTGLVRCPGDLLNLCSNVIAMREDGRVDFALYNMRQFLFTSRLLDPEVCHETITRICFHHLRRAEEPTWANPTPPNRYAWPTTPVDAFNRYARNNWHSHYRFSEKASNNLPERLRQLIEDDVVSMLSTEDYLSIEVQRITLSIALKISILHGFPVLELLCRQNGAQVHDTDLTPFTHISDEEDDSFYENLATLLQTLESRLQVTAKPLQIRTLKEHKL